MYSWYQDDAKEFGLVVIANVQEPDLSYEANEFIVCRRSDDDGYYYYGSDGGCSCYEGFDFANNLTRGSKQEMLAAFDSWNGSNYNDPNSVELKEDLLEQLRDSRV